MIESLLLLRAAVVVADYHHALFGALHGDVELVQVFKLIDFAVLSVVAQSRGIIVFFEELLDFDGLLCPWLLWDALLQITVRIKPEHLAPITVIFLLDLRCTI